MGKIVQPVNDFGPILDDISRRLAVLERAPVNVVDQLADTYTGVISQNITTVVPAVSAVTNTPTVVTLPAPSRLFIICQMQWAITAGTDFGYAFLTLDGVRIGQTSAITGNGPKGYVSATMVAAPSASGVAHTVAVVAHVGTGGATITVLDAELWIFRLGST